MKNIRINSAFVVYLVLILASTYLFLGKSNSKSFRYFSSIDSAVIYNEMIELYNNGYIEHYVSSLLRKKNYDSLSFEILKSKFGIIIKKHGCMINNLMQYKFDLSDSLFKIKKIQPETIFMEIRDSLERGN